jgi:hypothetical protein
MASMFSRAISCCIVLMELEICAVIWVMRADRSNGVACWNPGGVALGPAGKEVRGSEAAADWAIGSAAGRTLGSTVGGFAPRAAGGLKPGTPLKLPVFELVDMRLAEVLLACSV